MSTLTSHQWNLIITNLRGASLETAYVRAVWVSPKSDDIRLLLTDTFMAQRDPEPVILRLCEFNLFLSYILPIILYLVSHDSYRKHYRNSHKTGVLTMSVEVRLFPKMVDA